MSQDHFCKRAHGELPYVIFLSVFVTTMAVIGTILAKDTVNKIPASNSIVDQVINAITDTLKGIPVVGSFWNFIVMTYSFVNVNPQLSLLLGALIAVPSGYLIIRLLRGGG